jgi:hypothetical protein
VNFDDLPDTPAQPTQQASAGSQPPQLSFDELPSHVPAFDDIPEDNQSNPPQVGALEAGAIGAGQSAVPTAGGIAGAMAGAGVGGVVGGPVGAVVGGVAGGLGAGWLTQEAQDFLLDKLGLRDTVSKYSQAAHEQHPAAYDIGATAPIAAGMAFNPAATVMQRAGGAAVMGGIAGGQQLASGDYDPYEIAASMAAGAIAPTARPWASKIEQAGATLGGRMKGTGTGAIQNPVADVGQPGRPDLKTEAMDDDEYETVADTQSQSDAQSDAQSKPIDADTPTKWGPVLDRDFPKTNQKSEPLQQRQRVPTKDEQDTANDITKVSMGVAEDNPTAPELPDVGNPVGAAMQAREAAKPNNPLRDYRKNVAPAAKEGVATQDSTVVSTAPIHEDIAAALGGEQPQAVPQQAPTQPAPVENGLASSRINGDEANNFARQAAKQRQATALSSDADPLQASINQRAALQGIQRRQQLENFNNEPPPPMLDVDRKAAPASPVTAAVKPAETDPFVKQISDELRARGQDAAADKLDSLPPDQQAQLAQQVQDVLKTSKSKTTKAAGRPRLTGLGDGVEVTARDPKDAARKQQAIDAWRKAYEDHGPNGLPLDINDKAAVLQRARDAVATAKAANGGTDPLETYSPTMKVKPPEFSWYKAAKTVAVKPTPKMIKEFLAAHALGGQTGEAIDAAIGMQKAPTTEQVDKGNQRAPAERQQYDRLPQQPGKDNTYVDQANALRDYVENLPEHDYQTLNDMYASPAEFHEEVAEASNPDDVLSNFKQTLAATTGKRPGNLTPVPAEDVKGKPVRVTSRADLAATEPGAPASQGRSLKGSPEFERLAAQYGGMKVPDRTGRLEQEQEAATVNDWTTLDDKATKMSGGQEPPAFTRARPLGAGAIVPDDPAQAAAVLRDPQVIKDYGTELFDNLHLDRNDATQRRLQTQAYLTATPALGKVPDADMYRAIENKAVGTLPQQLQDYVRDHLRPMATKWKDVLQQVADFSDNHGFFNDLPAISSTGTKEVIPRRYVDQGWDDKDAAGWLDPMGGNPYSNWADSLQRRQEYALQNATTGERKIINLTRDEDGNWQLSTLGNGRKFGGQLPASFDGNIGDSISLLKKGAKAPEKWALDTATSDEIEKASGGKLVTMRSPAIAYAKAIEDANQVLANMKTIADIREDPVWKANTTTDYATAKERGYDLEPTSLKALAQDASGKQVYMPQKWKWTLDDVQKRGFGGTSLDPLRTAAQGFLKTFYVMSPVYHPLNEAALYTVGRGEKWLPVNGNYSKLGRSWMGAIKSVNTQDAIQQEIRDAGGSTMLAGSLVKDRFEDAMKKFGADVAKQPKAWDFITRQIGIDPADLAKMAINKSTDITWRLSDYLYTALYQEHKLNGMPPTEAVQATEKFMSNYRVPPTVGGSGRGGRLISQALQDPALSAFGPYKYGLWKSWADTTKDLLAKSSSPQERKAALGHLVTAGVLGFVIAPYVLDKLAQTITGNPDAKVRRFGPLALPDAISQAAQGNKALGVNEAWTPSIPVRAAAELANNTDWNGKPIVPTERFTPKGVGDVLANTADWAGRSLVPPYETVSNALSTRGGSALGAVGKLAAQQIGVSLPSEAARVRQQKIEKVNEEAARQRQKHPAGVIPELYNTLTR